MSGRNRALAAAAALVILAGAVVAVVATGGGGEDDSAPAERAESGAPGAGDEEADGGDGGGGGEAGGKGAGNGAPVDDELPPAAEVDRVDPPELIEDADNSIPTFGERADSRAADEIASVLAGYLDAQAEGDWELACALLASGVHDSLAELGAEGCASYLGAATEAVPRRQFRRQARIRLGDVRVDDDRAFALYKSAASEGRWMTMSMVREDGRWRVGMLDAMPMR